MIKSGDKWEEWQELGGVSGGWRRVVCNVQQGRMKRKEGGGMKEACEVIKRRVMNKLCSIGRTIKESNIQNSR